MATYWGVRCEDCQVETETETRYPGMLHKIIKMRAEIAALMKADVEHFIEFKRPLLWNGGQDVVRFIGTHAQHRLVVINEHREIDPPDFT